MVPSTARRPLVLTASLYQHRFHMDNSEMDYLVQTLVTLPKAAIADVMTPVDVVAK